MHTKRFKTQAKALGQYGRQWVGRTIRHQKRKIYTFAIKGLTTWRRVPKSAKMF